MDVFKGCSLCNSNKILDTASIGRRILYDGKYIYVAVDISPLSIGHILIITKSHYFNFYETDEKVKEETKKIKHIIQNVFKDIYHSETIFFEHGSKESGKAGSSIDHAHLHAIPLSIDMKSVLDNLLGESIECNILLEKFHNEFSYIYLENDNIKVIYKVDELPSQYLRKVVGEQINNFQYDWRTYLNSKDSLERLDKTYLDLKDKIK